MKYYVYIKDQLVGQTVSKELAYKLADDLKDGGFMGIRVDEVIS